MGRQPTVRVVSITGTEQGDLELSQSILDNAPVGMVIATASHRIVWTNAAMREIGGLQPGELIGRDFSSFVVAEDWPGLEDETNAILEGATAHTVRETRWQRADGGTRWLSVRTSVALTATGKPLLSGEPKRPSIIYQLTDISDRRRAADELAALHAELKRRNKELERSNEELTQFAYVASHDLSEPLRVISGHVELLAQRYDEQLDETGRAWVSFVVDGCTRMRTLIDDLLRYAGAGRESCRADVDLQAVVAKAAAQLAGLLGEAQAEVDVTGTLPVVTGDAIGLGQVFSNLITNAVKYARRGVPPRVLIGAEPVADGWRITVRDNGVGVPAHQRERIFRIFQRLHGREVPGTGIGLAICRKVVDQHGGRIDIEEAPDGGTVFAILLPTEGTFET